MTHTTQIILDIGIILVLANIIRAISIKIKLPPVIGLLILGKVLGPSLFNLVEHNPTIEWIAQVGVLFLIFSAGIQTNLKRLRQESKQAGFPAIGGIVVPFFTGFFITLLFNNNLASSLIVGTIFAAASISIPLMTLIDIDKFRSIEGRCIVNSAIINDIFSIILISILFSAFLFEGNGSVISIAVIPLLKVAAYFAVTFIAGKYLIVNLFANSRKLNLETSLLSMSVAIIFLYSWFAELLGLEAIIGALLSGFYIGQTEARHTVETGISQVGSSFLVDMFFVSIGLGLNLRALSFQPSFLVLFIVLAAVSKFLGSFAGASLSRFDLTRSLRIGVGLMPRGEISLIIASAAYYRGLISMELMSTATIMVIVTSIIAPFLIKFSYATTKKTTFSKHKANNHGS